MAHAIEKDAHDLYKKGEGRLGTDDDYFVAFFTTHSAPYIAVCQSTALNVN